MAMNVIVTGLPGDSKFSKLLFSFKKLLKRVQIRNFWIREVSDMYGSDCKQMCMEFPNRADAHKARDYLDNMSYTQGQAEYRLMAIVDDSSVEPREDWGRRRRIKRGRPVSRSPSPGFRSEASKLDLEIELLRKQRQVIEEERRLLLERKKLEMIREYGPSVTRDFDDFEPPPRKRRHPSETEARPRHRSPPPRKPKGPKPAPKGLPAFFQPCKRLVGEMRELINKGTTLEERGILVKLIRAAIRKNLGIALDGKNYMPTEDILTLYRKLHPQSTDEVFVGKILANIRASYLPDELEGKMAGTEKSEDNAKQPENSAYDLNVVVKDEIQTEGLKVEECAEDKVAANETDPERKPALEENGTDAGVEVKDELDASELNTSAETPAEENLAEPTADDAYIEELAEEAAVLPDNGEEASATEEQ